MNDIKTYNEVIKCSKKLMLEDPFYGLLLISLNKDISTTVPTAGVAKEKDQINFKLVVNPEFWLVQDEQSKIGVLKHELLHLAFFHLLNFESYENKELLNYAMDLEINQYIDSKYKGETWCGLEINNSPFKELNLKPFQGTKYYYEKLQNSNVCGKDGGKGGKGGKGNGLGEDGNNGEANEVNGNGSGSSLSDLMKELEGKVGDHSLWEKIEGLSEAERKLLEKQIDYQLTQIAEDIEKNQGKIPGELSSYISKLREKTEEVINWKQYLRRFNGLSTKVFTKKSRYKPNKRFTSNPALRIKSKKSTLVAIDTSGSVSDVEVAEFFNEINNIYKSGTEITIIECDSTIQRVYEYDGKLRDKIEVFGRGGTNFDPVFEYLKQHQNKFQNLIYLTDGEAGVPTVQVLKPVLWVHSSKSKINKELPGLKIKIN
jgi:predicted metal-dependent peptidase